MIGLARRRAIGAASAKPTYQDIILATPGLVSYWPMQETTGTTAADLAGGNNGTYESGVTLAQPDTGVTGSTSVLFDGVDGVVTVSNATNLQLAGSCSLEAWANWTNDSGALVGLYDSGNGNGYYVNSVDDTSFYVAGSGFDRNRIGFESPASQWMHVVCTWDGASEMIAYVDGVVAASQSVVGGLTADTSPFTIGGGNLGTTSGMYGGYIQHAAVYNQALTADQVQAHYAAGAGA